MADIVISALDSYRILDLTEGGCMLGARMLADLGADVIKVEPPGGSPSRTAPFYKDIPDPEKSLFWFTCNANKRGITLDLTDSADRNKFKKLVATADIVLESFTPGYMQKLGLAYDDLCKIKPDIIVTSITPYGQAGPKANFRSTDLTCWASGGYLYICGNPDRPPLWISLPQAFLFGGAEAAVGTLTALWHRNVTGEGQYVDVSIQECCIAPTMNALQMWDCYKVNFRRCGGYAFISKTGVHQPIYFKCKDGYVMILLQGGNDPFVSSSKRLVKWMEEEGKAGDWLPKIDWTTDYDANKMTQETADRGGIEVEKFTITKTKSELMEEGAIKRRILIAPLNNAQDISEDLQLKSRGYWVNIDHPELNKSIAYCGPFVKLSETPITYQRRPPLIGEHNKEIFGSTGRMDSAETPVTPVPPYINTRKTADSIQVFEGLKVAEFAWTAVGPCTSRYLADHGATVVKIESHIRLDTLRVTTPYVGGPPNLDRSMFFGRHNVNKYSVSIDLGHPAGQKLAWKLIMWADIVSESYSPRVMHKWGLDYENVKKVRPDIIYLSSSMQGHDGPHSSYIGYGQNACALSGFADASGWPDRVPAAPYGAYTDYIAPRFNAAALIAALDYRRRTGKGQWLDQSQFEASIHFFAPAIMDFQLNNRILSRNGNRLYNAAPHGVFPCKGDDCWIAISIFTDEEWEALCKALGNPEWVNKSEFSTLSDRKRNENELEKLLSDWTVNYTPQEAEAILQAEDVPANIVARPSDVYEDKQLQSRNYFVRLDHTEMGKPAFEPQACFLLSKTPRKLIRPTPCLGEHNEYVFKELLGMTDDEIAEHIIDGSITTQLPGKFQVNM
jgi:crotonobetainyl-CoA:carnitine CoA-transferase CaiB-like acyl-CoA transferase